MFQIPGRADAEPEGLSARVNVGETMITMHFQISVCVMSREWGFIEIMFGLQESLEFVWMMMMMMMVRYA